MITWIKVIIAIIEAVPLIEKFYQEAMIIYIERQKEKNNLQFLEALSKAKRTKNVKDISNSIGNTLDS